MEGIGRARFDGDGAVSVGATACYVSESAQSFYVRVAIANLDQVLQGVGADKVSRLLEDLYHCAVALVGHQDGVFLQENCLTMIVQDKPGSGAAGSDAAESDTAGSDAAGLRRSQWASIAVEHAVLQRLTDVAAFDGKTCIPAWTVSADAVSAELFESVADAPAGMRLALLEAKLAVLYPRPLKAMSRRQTVRDFHRDMAVATQVQSASTNGRVVMLWQPIVAADAAGSVLYCEGQAMIANPAQRFSVCSDSARTDMVATPEFMPALKRLGLTRAFDAHVMGLTLEHLLRVKTARLGCRIASQSASLNGWWLPVLRVLNAMPSVAQRLTIEIDGSDTEAALGPTETFVMQLRALGCRIAVGGFGKGPMSVREVAALKPDIVKIDPFFLRGSDHSAGWNVARHLVALAEAIGRDVVLEGVDSAAAEAEALRLGGRWLQGRFIASAAMTLRSSDDPVRHSPDPDRRARATAADPSASLAHAASTVRRSVAGSLGFSKLWSAVSR